MRFKISTYVYCSWKVRHMRTFHIKALIKIVIMDKWIVIYYNLLGAHVYD